MSRIPLTFACGLYDRVVALATGAVQVEGIDLNFINIDSPREIFDRMSGSLEFDAHEYDQRLIEKPVSVDDLFVPTY